MEYIYIKYNYDRRKASWTVTTTTTTTTTATTSTFTTTTSRKFRDETIIGRMGSQHTNWDFMLEWHDEAKPYLIESIKAGHLATRLLGVRGDLVRLWGERHPRYRVSLISSRRIARWLVLWASDKVVMLNNSPITNIKLSPENRA